jgi:hypothetical protein
MDTGIWLLDGDGVIVQWGFYARVGRKGGFYVSPQAENISNLLLLIGDAPLWNNIHLI